MSIFDDADRMGREMRAKLDADKAAKAAAEKQGEAIAKEIRQKEEDKEQGMI
jgi:hypothetical protein